MDTNLIISTWLNKNLTTRPADVKVLYTEQHTGRLKRTIIDEIGHV